MMVDFALLCFDVQPGPVVPGQSCATLSSYEDSHRALAADRGSQATSGACGRRAALSDTVTQSRGQHMRPLEKCTGSLVASRI